MSRIQDIINRLCPAGVPVKALGQVGEFIRGNGIQKSDLTGQGVPAIHYGQIHTHYGTWATDTISFVAPEFGRKLRKAAPGDLVIATTSEDDEAVGKAVAWVGDAPAAVSGDAYVYRHTLNSKYIAYFFQTAQFHDQKRAGITGTKVRRISGEHLAKIKIPVPPGEVQNEIVRVLDHFAELQVELQAELQAELEARRKQYAYYRDSMLTFEETPGRARWIPMGELGQIFRGKRFTKDDYVPEGGIGVIHYGEIYTQYGTVARQVVSRVRDDLASVLRFARKGDVVLTDVGETVEDVGKAVAWLGDEDVAIHDHCYVVRSTVNPAYLSYYMQTAAYIAAKDKYVARTKVKTLLLDGLKRILVPVPSTAEQEHIVSILDKFDTLVNDLSTGLPAEILARRQQYEHYRDKLLTFKEAA